MKALVMLVVATLALVSHSVAADMPSERYDDADCYAQCSEAYDRCVANGNTASACELQRQRCFNRCDASPAILADLQSTGVQCIEPFGRPTDDGQLIAPAPGFQNGRVSGSMSFCTPARQKPGRELYGATCYAQFRNYEGAPFWAGCRTNEACEGVVFREVYLTGDQVCIRVEGNGYAGFNARYREGQ